MTTKSGGAARTSGLGSSVVKAITAAQGGSVSLRTDAEGTSVALTLPLDTGHGAEGNSAPGPGVLQQ